MNVIQSLLASRRRLSKKTLYTLPFKGFLYRVTIDSTSELNKNNNLFTYSYARFKRYKVLKMAMAIVITIYIFMIVTTALEAKRIIGRIPNCHLLYMIVVLEVE